MKIATEVQWLNDDKLAGQAQQLLQHALDVPTDTHKLTGQAQQLLQHALDVPQNL